MTQSKTARLVGLFVAAALTVGGCSSEQGYDDDCYDYDNDGYCDDDSSGGSGRGSTYVNTGGKKIYTDSSRMSTGSSGYKGGIGSSGFSSSG
jgi:hypothetical protein